MGRSLKQIAINRGGRKNFDFDTTNPLFHHSQLSSGCEGKIQNTAWNIGASVIQTNKEFLVITKIGDSKPRIEGEGLMSGSEGIHVVCLPISCHPPMKGMAIPRGLTYKRMARLGLSPFLQGAMRRHLGTRGKCENDYNTTNYAIKTKRIHQIPFHPPFRDHNDQEVGLVSINDAGCQL